MEAITKYDINAMLEKYGSKNLYEHDLMAKVMLDDMDFLLRFHQKTKGQDDYNSLLIIPMHGNLIYDFFIRKAAANLIIDGIKLQDRCDGTTQLGVILVCLDIIKGIVEDDKKKPHQVAKELEEAGRLTMWFYGISIFDCLHAFVGCSSRMEAILEAREE